jgi:hypothetical protein
MIFFPAPITIGANPTLGLFRDKGAAGLGQFVTLAA